MTWHQLATRVSEGRPQAVQNMLRKLPAVIDSAREPALVALREADMPPAVRIKIAQQLLPLASSAVVGEFLENTLSMDPSTEDQQKVLLSVIMTPAFRPEPVDLVMALQSVINQGRLDVAATLLPHVAEHDEILSSVIIADHFSNELLTLMWNAPQVREQDRVRAVKTTARYEDSVDRLSPLLSLASLDTLNAAADQLFEAGQPKQVPTPPLVVAEWRALDHLAKRVSVDQAKLWVSMYGEAPFPQFIAQHRQDDALSTSPHPPHRHRRLRS